MSEVSKKQECPSGDVAIVVMCVDWRMHHPKSNLMDKVYGYMGCEKAYIVTYPGPDGLCDGMNCACERKDFETIINRTRRVMAEHDIFSARKVLMVHSDCAGHAVSDDEHRAHAKKVVQEINEELHCNTPFEPLIAVRKGSNMEWDIEKC